MKLTFKFIKDHVQIGEVARECWPDHDVPKLYDIGVAVKMFEYLDVRVCDHQGV